MSFIPREDLINILLDLGITRNAATRALYYTGNHNAELAAAYVFENPDNVDMDAPVTDLAELDASSDDEEEHMGADMAAFLQGGEFYKMVFVVNTELNMGIGKVAAQVAHGALGLYRTLTEDPRSNGPALMAWEQFGETKIVLKAESALQLTELAVKAQGRSLPHYLVEDAGRTQVAAGSMTVLGIMGKNSSVDQVTGSLPLL